VQIKVDKKVGKCNKIVDITYAKKLIGKDKVI